MNKPVLVVLAAGMGSRYGGLKQMDSVAGHGQSIIDYSIYDARRAGFEKVIFVIKRDWRRTSTAWWGTGSPGASRWSTPSRSWTICRRGTPCPPGGRSPGAPPTRCWRPGI